MQIFSKGKTSNRIDSVILFTQTGLDYIFMTDYVKKEQKFVRHFRCVA